MIGHRVDRVAAEFAVRSKPWARIGLLLVGIAIFAHQAVMPAHAQAPKDEARSLNARAVELYRAGRVNEAIPLAKRSLELSEKTLPAGHRDIATAINNLATFYEVAGQFAEAERLHKRALEMREKTLPAGHLDIAMSLNNLAVLYRKLGRLAEAEPLYKRTIEMREKALPAGHPDIARSLNNLAVLYSTQDRLDEAEALHKRALDMREKALPPGHPDIASTLSSLALVLQKQGRLAEAARMLVRSLEIREKALPAGHPDLAVTLNNLALVYSGQGRLAEAETIYRRALEINEATRPPGHPDISLVLNNLAAIALQRRDWAGALALFSRGTDLTIARVQRTGLAETQAASTEHSAENPAAEAHNFYGYIKAAYQLGAKLPAERTRLAADAFNRAQWSMSSEAAASLTNMAARSARGDPALARVVRERQDLVNEWRQRDRALVLASTLAPQQRDAASERALRDRLAAIDTAIARIDRSLTKDFPEFSNLSRSEPVPVEEVQTLLGSNEALVLVLDTWAAAGTPDESFLWIVTKNDLRWVRSPLGKNALTREVAALRCGLDTTAWHGEGAERCSKLLNVAAPPREGDPLPFDHARAHALYKGLFGEVGELIKGKHLLVVSSARLMQLPFQVLVTAPPRPEVDHRDVAWLARSHAVTVLPAVSSLKALRRVARPSAATKPIIGFGNPLLDGPDQRHAQRARLARDTQRCPDARPRQVAAQRGLRTGAAAVTTRGGLADLAQLKMQTPLPETADELCAVARDLGADAGEMRLGARATETEIKALSEAGALARYRIVHFATHGTLAGQLSGTTEPGLILTPPATASERDDGYLSASEIAALRLDADWVILSACNTAAGGATAAEALSGVARGFFYAQARALLVSHWEVDSDATVKLIVTAVAAITRDASIGRAEALRGAMLAMIDKGDPHHAHPAFWAPFVVVGEGAR